MKENVCLGCSKQDPGRAVLVFGPWVPLCPPFPAHQQRYVAAWCHMSSAYQGGPSYEVFTPQGSRPLPSTAQLTNAKCIRKEFDKALKGNVVCIEGDTMQTKFQLANLNLTQPFLVIQLCAREGTGLYLEFLVTDTSVKRRVIISTSVKEAVRDPLHIKLPLHGIPRGRWLNLCFDVPNLCACHFRGMQFKALDRIVIGPTCRLRKMFTLKHALRQVLRAGPSGPGCPLPRPLLDPPLPHQSGPAARMTAWDAALITSDWVSGQITDQSAAFAAQTLKLATKFPFLF